MQNRQLALIHHLLSQTPNQSLFSTVSPIYALEKPPTPLSSDDMHMASAGLIRSATQEVLLLFYKFNVESEGGRAIFEALTYLKEKAEREKSLVNIHVIINSRSKLAEFVYKENSLTGLEEIESNEYFKFHFTTHRTTMFGSLHSKMIIVDSSRAILLSGDPEPANNRNRHRHETSTLIEGPVINDMRREFCLIWQANSNIPVANIPPYNKSSNKNLDDRIPCFYIAKKSYELPLLTSMAQSPFKIALIAGIQAAKSSIHIMTSNLNDREICEALAEACNAGITVRLLTGKYHNDHSEQLWGGTNRIAIASIANQVESEKLQYLNIRYVKTPQGDIVSHGDKFNMHAKYACIDKQLVFIGSSPLDVQGMNYSRESDFIFEDIDTAKQFENLFFKDKFNSSYDHFEDAYHSIFIAIEQHYKRIKLTSTDELRTTKAANIQEILTNLSESKINYLDRIYLLLSSTLPTLALQTGNKPGMPYSYNMIYKHAVGLGCLSILNSIANCPAPLSVELESTTATISSSPYTLSYLSSSPANRMHRSLSMSSLSDHSEERKLLHNSQ